MEGVVVGETGHEQYAAKDRHDDQAPHRLGISPPGNPRKHDGRGDGRGRRVARDTARATARPARTTLPLDASHITTRLDVLRLDASGSFDLW